MAAAARDATVEEVADILGSLRPKLPQRLVRQVITCLQIGKTRRKDPAGVYIHAGSLQGASDRDPPVQICFSFDTTGSMAAYIQHVREQITKLVEHLFRHIPGIQVSIAAHGDYGDETPPSYVVKAKDFSNDVAALKAFIEDECGNTGGGDHPECYELVVHKMQELSWAATSAKALVMIGDAPPHGKAKYESLGRPFIDWKKEAQWYVDRDIHIYGVRCGGSRDSFYDQVAKQTGALTIEVKNMDLMPELFTELCFREQQRWALARHPPPAWEIRAISDPKRALLNVCGSCTLAEPSFHEASSVTKQRIRLLCRRLARDGSGEFVLQMALYCRTKLYLRSVSNYLTCVAAATPGCKEHFYGYFKEIIRLPTDMLEVAKMSVSQQEVTTRISLPHGLRKAMAKKFADFSEYQLSKHKKKEKLAPDGTWISGSAQARGKADRSKGNGKGAKDDKDEGHADVDLSKCPVLSMKSLIRLCHITEPHELVMKVLGKRYPETEEAFAESGLPGPFDSDRAWERLRLKEALTFQTQLSKKGNTTEAWQELIDKNGLPFMALIRNLRNILMADLTESHHEKLLQRLKDKKQVTESMQMPHRFLTAFLAVDAAAEGKEFGKGGGKGKGKGKGKGARGGAPAAPAPEEGQKLLPKELAERYKKALDEAVQIAVAARLGHLGGDSVVLCDVSGSMRYNEFAESAKGIAGVTSAADLAILLGLILFHMSDGPGHCKVALFADGEPVPLDLSKDTGILPQFTAAKDKVGAMAKTTELPIAWLRETLAEFPANRVVLLSDMLLGQHRNHPGGGGELQEVLAKHREARGQSCSLVCVDLFGSGANSGLDLSGDCGNGDILLSGFSDHMLAYIANPDAQAQVTDVENIMQTLRAEEEAKAKAKATCTKEAWAAVEGDAGNTSEAAAA